MAEQLVGGQALIDGVMIRRGQRWAAASRLEDGSLVTAIRTVPLALAPVRGVPVIRGIGALIDSLRVGAAAMRWSGDQRGDSPVRTTRDRLVVVGVVGIVVATFLLVPLSIGARVSSATGWSWMLGPVEGVVRLGFFVAYLAMLSRLPGVRSTLEYHGAEHMTIAAHEHGRARGVRAVREFSVRHPRCGTDFFLLIFAVSIVVFSLVGTLPAGWLVVSRVLGLPVIVGISYEILRAGGQHSLLARPGLFLQRFTTAEPTDAQIEVALAALIALLGDEFPVGDGLLAPEATQPVGLNPLSTAAKIEVSTLPPESTTATR